MAIDIADLDLKAQTVKVLGKGRKERYVVFGKNALHALTVYLQGVRPFLRGTELSCLFLSTKGKRIGIKGVETRVELYAKKAKLKNVTPHTFRRSATTELVKSDANLFTVSKLLGHESVNMIMHYAKLRTDDLRECLKKHHPREKDRT